MLTGTTGKMRALFGTLFLQWGFPARTAGWIGLGGLRSHLGCCKNPLHIRPFLIMFNRTFTSPPGHNMRLNMLLTTFPGAYRESGYPFGRRSLLPAPSTFRACFPRWTSGHSLERALSSAPHRSARECQRFSWLKLLATSAGTEIMNLNSGSTAANTIQVAAITRMIPMSYKTATVSISVMGGHGS